MTKSTALNGRMTKAEQESRDDAEKALDRVRDAQTALWNALSDLESELGIDIDDATFDFANETLESLKERFA